MTKFHINKDETYEIKFQDEYSEKDISHFFEKTQLVWALINNNPRVVHQIKNEVHIDKEGNAWIEKDNLKKDEPDKKKKRKYNKSGKYKNHKNSAEPKSKVKHRKHKKSFLRWDDRDEVVNALRILYRGTPELKQRFANMKRTDWDTIVKSLYGLRKRYKVTPQEVGVSHFPLRGELGLGRKRLE